jgi:small-conductance mechanosensitive channel
VVEINSGCLQAIDFIMAFMNNMIDLKNGFFGKKRYLWYTEYMIEIQNILQQQFVAWFLSDGLRIVGIIIGTIVASRSLRFVIDRMVRNIITSEGFDSEMAEKKREDTIIAILVGTMRVIIWIIAGMMILSETGVNIGPILAGAGIVGLAVGFGGQYLIRDVINGIFLIWENQLRIGDVVCIGDLCGTVEKISLRIVTLRSLDGIVHIIPNGEIKTVSNHSKDFARINMNIGVSYNADIDTVSRVINAVGDEMASDPTWRDKIKKAPQFLRVENFGDSAVELKVLGETCGGEQWAVAGEFRRRIKYAFDKEGIEIPFPQRVIRTLN